MKKSVMLFYSITLIIATFISNYSFGQIKAESENAILLSDTDTYKANMRRLWIDHVTLTGNVIFCIVDDLPGKKIAVKSLLQNQIDIGNSIKPYLGEDAGKKLSALLNEHINIMIEVVGALLTDNTAIFDEANKKWHVNADEISEFIGNVNSNWKMADIKMMMNNHLKLTTNEMMQRIKEDCDANVIAYDKVHNEIQKISDIIAAGVVKQFPEKFEIDESNQASK